MHVKVDTKPFLWGDIWITLKPDLVKDGPAAKAR